MKNVALVSWQTTLLSICCLFAITVLVSACFEPSITKTTEKKPISAMGKESILIIRVVGKNFEQVVLGLSEELTEEFFLQEMIVDKNTQKGQIAQNMKEVSPKFVVLMDNVSISLYKEYQKGLSDAASIVPAVAVMASFMDMAIKNLRNAKGIFYEVPLVTSVVTLRAVLSSRAFDRVGVIHREFMAPAIRLNQKYCAREDVKLISYPIPNKGNIKSNLKNALNKLGTENVNALWIPNDNKLVNAKLLKSVWIPFAKKFNKPIITGVEILVEPKLKFGTFAVIPDPVQLGTQAAEMVFEAMEDDWKIEAGEVEPPRSVYKIINLKQAEHLFSVDEEKLQNMVDKILTEL